MESKGEKLHVVVFPALAHGHMIPAIDMAKQFATRGLKVTIVTTTLNLPFFSKTIERARNLGSDIMTHTLRFPATEAGLPEGCENTEYIMSRNLSFETLLKFGEASHLLQEPLERFLESCHPHCLVADMLHPWANEAAAKFGIPRLVFHFTSFFSTSVSICMTRYEPQKKVSSDTQPFVVPNFPGDIKFTRTQLSTHLTQETESDFAKWVGRCTEANSTSYGAVFNSFYELEPAYADYYRNVVGIKAWHIGPVSLCNKDMADKAERGKEPSIQEEKCLGWLDSKKPESVLYVCFGSMFNFSSSQLKEIALGLEASGQDFIWVVKKSQGLVKEDWLPENFEERNQNKGLIIRGWAPQVLILEHQAIGGFVTHCGWNSTLEGVTAKVPMVTWPISAEQFYNEKLITDVLRVGVPVGAKEWAALEGDGIKNEAIKRAVLRVMQGEEAESMRMRVKSLGVLARKAVEIGGSSYSDLSGLIEELRSLHHI